MLLTDELDDAYFQACADFLLNSLSLDGIFFELNHWIDTMSNAVTKSEFAKLINRKPSYVTELAKYGRLVFDETGKKVLVDESLALIEESKDLSKTGVTERHEKKRAKNAQSNDSEKSNSYEPTQLKNEENIVTKSAFAKIIGKRPSYVTELAQSDRLVLIQIKNKDFVKVKESIELIEATKDLSKEGVTERHENKRGNTSKNNSIQEGTRAYWQLREQAARAKKAEIEVKRLEGSLLVASETIQAFSKAVSIMRLRFETQPDRLASQLALEKDVSKCRAMILDDNEQFLTELSNSFKKAEQEIIASLENINMEISV